MKKKTSFWQRTAMWGIAPFCMLCISFTSLANTTTPSPVAWTVTHYSVTTGAPGGVSMTSADVYLRPDGVMTPAPVEVSVATNTMKAATVAGQLLNCWVSATTNNQTMIGDNNGKEAMQVSQSAKINYLAMMAAPPVLTADQNICVNTNEALILVNTTSLKNVIGNQVQQATAGKVITPTSQNKMTGEAAGYATLIAWSTSTSTKDIATTAATNVLQNDLVSYHVS